MHGLMWAGADGGQASHKLLQRSGASRPGSSLSSRRESCSLVGGINAPIGSNELNKAGVNATLGCTKDGSGEAVPPDWSLQCRPAS